MILRSVLKSILLLICISAAAWGQEPFSMEVPSAETLKPVPAPLRDLLNPTGSSVVTTVNGLKATAVTVWWMKSIPSAEKAVSGPGISYGGIRVGALVGVLNFPPESTPDFREDSRDQKLKPGFYTMRYARLPGEAGDKDPSALQDYVLLSPLSLDTDYTKILTLDDLVKLSNHASHTKHPAIISLVPVNDHYMTRPGIIVDDTGRCTLQVTVHTSSASGNVESEMQLAIVVVTPQTEMGGS